jgi:hypothetical protein
LAVRQVVRSKQYVICPVVVVEAQWTCGNLEEISNAGCANASPKSEDASLESMAGGESEL